MCAPAPDSPLALFLQGAVPFYIEFYERYGSSDGASMHDPLALAIAIDPSLAHLQTTRVEVETDGTWTRGETVTDLRADPPEPLADRLDARGQRTRGARRRRPAFMSRFIERLRSLVEAAREGRREARSSRSSARSTSTSSCRARHLPGPGRPSPAERSPSITAARAGTRRWRRPRDRSGAMLNLGPSVRASGCSVRSATISSGWRRWRRSVANDVRTDHVLVTLGRAHRRRAHRGRHRRREPDLGGARRERHPFTGRYRRCPRDAHHRTCSSSSLEVPERTAHDALRVGARSRRRPRPQPAPPHPWAQDLSRSRCTSPRMSMSATSLGAIPAGRRRDRDPRRRGRGDPPARRNAGGVLAPTSRWWTRRAPATASTACSPPASP